MSRRWLGAVIVTLSWVFALVVYPSLPERMPIHWNASGEVDRWGSAGTAAFLMPLVLLASWLLFQGLPKIDPRQKQYEQFWPTYWLLVNTTLLFLAGVHVAAVGAGLGWAVDMGRLVMAGLGIVLLVLGNFLPRVRPNWWMGIRTPWTLSSDRVWRETHRFGGWVFTAGGLLIVTAVALVDGSAVGVVGGVAAVVLTVLTFGYSYLAWRREQRETAS